MKYQRLIFGLVILISLFFLTGSSESDICYECDPTQVAKLTIKNISSYQFIRVTVAGVDEWTFDLFQEAQEYLRLMPGLYFIIALAGPDNDKVIYTQAVILDAGDDTRIYIEEK